MSWWGEGWAIFLLSLFLSLFLSLSLSLSLAVSILSLPPFHCPAYTHGPSTNRAKRIRKANVLWKTCLNLVRRHVKNKLRKERVRVMREREHLNSVRELAMMRDEEEAQRSKGGAFWGIDAYWKNKRAEFEFQQGMLRALEDALVCVRSCTRAWKQQDRAGQLETAHPSATNSLPAPPP